MRFLKATSLNALRPTILSLTTIILVLSVATTLVAVHPPIKRHISSSAAPKQPKSNIPKRGHPFPEYKRSATSTWFAKLLGSPSEGRRKKVRVKGKGKKSKGPGPGYAASLAARNRDLEHKKQQQKRQANLANSSATATGTATSSAASASSTSNTTSSGAPVWILEDVYAGPSFFDYFTFYNYKDPTNGLVNYVDENTAFSSGLAYVNNNKIIMKADNTTVLSSGQNRNSVRIQSDKTYTGGLFLLDMDRGPYGCGVWPAFWTTNANWPYNGEIDIYEGVHLSTNNQMTWHTDAGCTLTVPGGFSGYVNTTDCNALINNNEGCAVTDTSYSSSGATLQKIGGGVFAMKWDTTGISVWFFPRAVIPDDILAETPDPTLWGTPQARLLPNDCNIVQHFQEHQIIFNITFCGDWAGMTYLTSGCPGTCNDQIMEPSNFNEAIWQINSLRVFTNSDLQAGVLNGATSWRSGRSLVWNLCLGLLVSLLVGVVEWL